MEDLVQTAIQRLQTASDMSLKIYKQPLIVTTSGGKDSSVCVELAQMAKIPFEVQHNHTTADAPETVYFVRSEFKRLEEKGIKCTINWPKYKGEYTSMWKLIPQALMPPNRWRRYCCTILKEQGGSNRFIATGVRWAESKKRETTRGIYETVTRKKENKVILNNDNDDRRRLFETCSLKAKRVVNPIVDWSDRNVWDFIHERKVPVNPLYDCEYERVGCVGCCLASRRLRERDFLRYPKYKDMYIKAFDKMIIARRERERERERTDWESGEEVFNWWMEYDVLPGQATFDDLMDDDA